MATERQHVDEFWLALAYAVADVLIWVAFVGFVLVFAGYPVVLVALAMVGVLGVCRRIALAGSP